MSGTFVMFVFVFLDCYVVTVVVFVPFVLKFTVKKMFYMYKFCGILAHVFASMYFWPGKDKHDMSSYTANE
jgi:hypothetical protein